MDRVHRFGFAAGVALTYYESGKLQLETSYTDDVKNGLTKEYDESGHLSSEIPFIEG